MESKVLGIPLILLVLWLSVVGPLLAYLIFINGRLGYVMQNQESLEAVCLFQDKPVTPDPTATPSATLEPEPSETPRVRATQEPSISFEEDATLEE